LVFALEGGLTAARAGLDLLGILVLAFLTATGGGIVRDVLLGEQPPAAMRDWRYPALALTGTALVAAALLGGVAIDSGPVGEALTLLDAGGLALFAATGTAKAIDHGLNAPSVIALGTMTGCGGGTLRDVLLARVPAILSTGFYATAALAGATLMLVMVRWADLGRVPSGIAAALLVFMLRLAAVGGGWNLPHLS
jgi:uncharacterized membrane protein YeiH